MWPKGPVQQSSDLEQLQPMQNQNAMLDACEAGDVPKLQQLFKAAGVRQGDSAFEPFFGEPVPPNGPPPTATMVAAAVAHKQPAIVQCLLATYRNVHLDRSTVVEAVLANPHLPTLEVLHSHTPSIVNFQFQDTHATLLMEASRTDNPFLPLILLGLGADPSECNYSGVGPLSVALKYLQPFDVIRMLIEHGATITHNALEVAISRQSPEILRFLLDRARICQPKDLLEQAQGTGDKRIAALVYDRIKKGEKSPLKRRKKKGTLTFVYEERIESKWWQLGR
ncbi:hypothetical protein ACLMJK_002554 [Lecanora helva]